MAIYILTMTVLTVSAVIFFSGNELARKVAKSFIILTVCFTIIRESRVALIITDAIYRYTNVTQDELYILIFILCTAALSTFITALLS